MTLNTRIRITDPIAVRPVFDKARELIGAADAYVWTHRQTVDHDWQAGTKEYRMQLGQGLPALMDVTYGADGPLPAVDNDDPDGESLPEPQAFVEVAFDTSYGYRADNGANCGDLHAYFVREMTAWLDAQGKGWWWYDECGEGWLPDLSSYGALGDPDVGRLR